MLSMGVILISQSIHNVKGTCGTYGSGTFRTNCVYYSGYIDNITIIGLLPPNKI